MPVYGLGNAVGAVGAEGDFGAIDGFQAPPVCTVQPVVSGSAALGSTLTTTDGTFVGTGLGAVSRQWYRGTNTPIAGQTASTYVTAAADYGLGVFCVVSRANAVGSASGTSNAITVTATAPVNTVAGVLSGSGAPGATLTCTSGTWTGSPTITFVYQFYLNGVADGSAGANTRVNQVGDVGKTVTCKPIGTNIVSTVTGTASNGIVVVAPSLTWDSSQTFGGAATFSNGDLSVAIAGSAEFIVRATGGKSSGVWAFVAIAANNVANAIVGVQKSTASQNGDFLPHGNTQRGLRTINSRWLFIVDIDGAMITAYQDAVLWSGPNPISDAPGTFYPGCSTLDHTVTAPVITIDVLGFTGPELTLMSIAGASAWTV